MTGPQAKEYGIIDSVIDKRISLGGQTGAEH